MKLKIVAAVLLIAGLSACASKSEKEAKELLKASQMAPAEQRALAAELYRAAREALDSGEFGGAVTRYNTLKTRFPFTDYAIQGELERVYAEYRSYNPEDAISAADHFLRDYPRHPNADYVQYLKGMVNFDRDKGFEALFGVDVSKRDVTNLRRSFDDFALLIQKYPSSKYLGDARQRMIDLRNRIAAHELSVVDFYMSRGAYVAASKRAEQIVSQFPGAPATLDALRQLEKSYRELKLDGQADDARKLLTAYTDPAKVGATVQPADQPTAKPAAAPASDVPPPLAPPSAPIPDPAPDAPQEPSSTNTPG